MGAWTINLFPIRIIPMTIDRLYSNGPLNEDFQFNERVADVFDDMVSRSVPFYKTVIETTAGLIRHFAAPGSTVYDLGCSTGTTLLTLSTLLADLDLQFIGLDNAPAMIRKARNKASMFRKDDIIEFRRQDITDLKLERADVIICNYTLQFIRPMLRQNFTSSLYSSLAEDGILIISEKVISEHHAINRRFSNLYHEFKLKQGYSELEISAKREALENVLIPFTVQENFDLLHTAGFRSVESFFRWINFISIIAHKNV